MRVFQSAGDRWSQAIATLTFADTMSDVRLELSEAGPTYEQALALFEDLGSLWGIALSANGLSSIVYQQGDYERARSLASYSLQISASLNQPWNVIGARLRLGQVATALGDYDEAIRHYQQNLQEIQELGSEWFCGVLLDALGYTEVLRGDLKAAEGHFQASLEIGRKLNASHSIGMALGNLGDVAYRRGDLAGSLGLYRQALEQIEAAQGLWGITVMTKKIGYIHLDQGELEAAEAQFQRSLAISLQIERDPQVLELFTGYARLALLRQDAEQAVALLHLAASHPKTAQDIRQQAQTRLAELAAELPAGVILRGREQGAALANLALAEVARRYLPA
jgi:tetratricopeptide (TPR) repeat protein